MAIVEEECDEAVYWMELLVEAGIIGQERLSNLMREAREILAMVIASKKTARRNASISGK